MGKEGSCPGYHKTDPLPTEGAEAVPQHGKDIFGYSWLGLPVEERAGKCFPICCCWFPEQPWAGPCPSLGPVSPVEPRLRSLPLGIFVSGLWHLNSPASFLPPVPFTPFYHLPSLAVNSQAVLFVSRQVTVSLHTLETQEMLTKSPGSNGC